MAMATTTSIMITTSITLRNTGDNNLNRISVP